MPHSHPHREERIVITDTDSNAALDRPTCPVSGRPHCGRACPAVLDWSLGESEVKVRACPGESGRQVGRAYGRGYKRQLQGE